MKKLLLLSLIVIGQLSYAQRIDVKSIKLLNGTEQDIFIRFLVPKVLIYSQLQKIMQV